jgi:hypothetical protein
MLSPDQLKLYWTELRQALSALNKSASSAESADVVHPVHTRESFHAQHNLPPSTKQFTREHFDTFLAACKAITQPSNLKPQLRAFDQPKTRLLHKILVEQAALLDALYASDRAQPSPGGEGPGVRANYRTGLDTIRHICADKFRGRLPVDLSESHRSVFGSQYSELETLLFTVARTISKLRQARGWTEHELRWEAGLGDTCRCADCRRAKLPKVDRVAPLVEADAEANPF